MSYIPLLGYGIFISPLIVNADYVVDPDVISPSITIRPLADTPPSSAKFPIYNA